MVVEGELVGAGEAWSSRPTRVGEGTAGEDVMTVFFLQVRDFFAWTDPDSASIGGPAQWF